MEIWLCNSKQCSFVKPKNYTGTNRVWWVQNANIHCTRSPCATLAVSIILFNKHHLTLYLKCWSLSDVRINSSADMILLLHDCHFHLLHITDSGICEACCYREIVLPTSQRDHLFLI